MNWNLNLIYGSEADFEADFAEMENTIVRLEELKGTLNTYEGFRKYILLDIEASKRINRLYTYVAMSYDLNQKDTPAKERYTRVYTKYNELLARTAWIQPELLSVGEPAILDFCSSEELKASTFAMKKLFRMHQHIRDEQTEEVMARYQDALGVFQKLYTDLTIGDNQSRRVRLSTGETLKVNDSNYRYYLATVQNQKDRKRIFEAVFRFYFEHKSTLADIYNGILQSELAECRNRGYASILDHKLYPNRIDKAVYTALIETARANTEPLKEYIELRKKYFNLEEYHTYDRFLSFRESRTEYTYEASKAMVLDACRKMGEDFYQKACQVLEDGRVSVEMKDGKAGGAYSTSTYENGPFILLNHNCQIDDAFTIAHEAGHSIHTLYSIEGQPYQTADYVIFVAEIASTFNEQLFLDYLLEHTRDKNERIAVLQQAIDGLIATFYRQTLFADYEYQAHQMAEEGKPITADALSNIMTELYNAYYGIDLTKEKYKSMVWAYIPHFFATPFYVYQYATSFSASLAIYERVKNKEPKAMDDYLTLLKSGGSDYPVELVQRAGVDLTKKDAFMAVVHRLSSLVKTLKKELEEEYADKKDI